MNGLALWKEFMVVDTVCLETNKNNLYARFLEPQLFSFGIFFHINAVLCCFVALFQDCTQNTKTYHHLPWKESIPVSAPSLIPEEQILAHTFLFPKFCSTIVCTVFLLMFQHSAIIWGEM
jgi:hypothetical protein